MNESISPPEAILCIPGPWASRDELAQAIARDGHGYVFAGHTLVEVNTRDTFELQFEPADPRMLKAFLSAGHHWAQAREMTRIAGHASVAYLIGHGGSRKNAESLMLAAGALLEAGGLGVKVESAGIAHSPAMWQRFLKERHLFSAHNAFVVYVTGAEVCSCGMHNLGLREVVVDNFETADAVDLVRTFAWYLFTEEPAIQAGQTFSVSADAPVYRIAASSGVPYPPGSPFTNPYGAWRLEAA